MRHRRVVFAALWVCVAVACAQKDQPAKKPMTTAQRDSAIGESKLPGAGVVKKALEQSDSAKARANEPVPEPGS